MALAEIIHKPFILEKGEQAREIGGVKEIIANPQGWMSDQLTLRLFPARILGEVDLQNIPENPTGLQKAWMRTYKERVVKQKDKGEKPDFNGPKVAVRYLTQNSDGNLEVDAQLTDFFTLWGLPGVAKDLHDRAVSELTEQRGTEIPIGVSTHNMLVIGEGDNRKVVMAVQSRGQAFSAGRISTTLEEQMEPTQWTPFRTASAGFQEELGIEVPVENIQLLGVAAEKSAAYTSWAFVVKVPELTEESIRKSWESATDKKEGMALFFIPLNEIDQWMKEEIPFDTWCPYAKDDSLKSGTAYIEQKALPVHSTALWRLTLLQEHLKTQEDNS